jgi:acid phosphatase family membrane protein YuiD
MNVDVSNDSCAIQVMYDASGIRFHTGRQAAVSGFRAFLEQPELPLFIYS